MLVPYLKCTETVQQRAASLVAREFDYEGADAVNSMFQDQITAWVDCIDDDVNGIFSIQVQPPNGFVPCFGNFAVAPAARGKGIGTSLLKTAEQILSDQGWANAFLWCNSTLKPFYEKRGWTLMSAENSALPCLQACSAEREKIDVATFIMTKQLDLPRGFAAAFTSECQYSLLAEQSSTDFSDLFT